MATAPPSSNQALYRACMKEAAAQSRNLMQRVVRRALMEMPEQAAAARDFVERNLLAEAARVLMTHQAILFESFPQALLQEFAAAIAGDMRRAAGVSFDSLDVMADEQVQESVEVVRTLKAVNEAVAPELGELNTLISAVQGFPSARTQRNPLRPEVYVRALRTVTQQSPIAPSARRRWLLHLGFALGPELAQTYAQLSALLRAQGVTGVPESAPMPLLPPQPLPNDERALLNVRELRRLLAGEFDPPGAAAQASGPPDFNMTMPAAFEALQEMRQVDQVMQRLRQRQVAQPQPDGGVGAMRQALHHEARTPGQQLGFEVVSLMVENIAGDARLLPPVQQAVRDLEPALLRLALADPRFFSDKKHPARQLLLEMTQRSLAWTSVDAPGFREFMQPLQDAVAALGKARSVGAEPFEIALRTLGQAWGDAQAGDSRERERAVRALLRAEQRNLLADKIAQQVRARADLGHAPAFVRQFVAGPWSQVMAQARLADASGAPDPGGYLAVVPELVLAATQPARAARLLPQLVDRIRRGLGMIDFPPPQGEHFLAQLAAAAREEPPEARESEDTQDAWLGPTEAQQSNFVALSVPAQLRTTTTQPGFIDTAPSPAESAVAEHGLGAGAWVDLFTAGSWGRWQLTWCSPHGTLFMFTHVSGKTQSMSRRLVQKLLIAGALKVVTAQAVVDGALDLVADKALRNSV